MNLLSLKDMDFPLRPVGEHVLTMIGYLVKQNKDNGLELARANSVVLSGLAVSRIVATSGRAPVPWALGATGALATWYYQKKIWEYEYGV